MQIRISLRKGEMDALLERLRQAYARGELRLFKRIRALLSILEGKSMSEVTAAVKVSNQTIYNYISAFVLKRLDS